MKRMLLAIITFLYRFTRERITLDKVNQKVIEPVPGLILKGRQYYRFKNVADMPQNRFVHYLDFRQESDMNISRDVILKYVEELKTANNSQDASRIGSLLFMLEDSLANCTPLEMLYNLASLVYFTKQEDLSCYDYDYNQDKIALFKAHTNKDFFFRTLLEQTLKITGNMSPSDIEQYLRVSLVKLRAYEQILTGE